MENKFELGGSAEAIIQQDAFLFQYPLRSIKVPFRDIYGYYIYPFLKDKFLLVIAYNAGKKTRRLNIPLDASVKEAFMDQIQALSPASANLLHMEKKQALRTMGAKDQIAFTVMILLGVVMPAIFIGLFFPALWHGIFDSSLTQTSIEDIYAGKSPDSNYISFDAVLGNKSVVITEASYRRTSRDMWLRSETRNGYYPLYPQGWEQGQPVRAVLLVREQDKASVAAQQGQPIKISGLIRNILWEGLSTSNANILADHIDSPVENPILVEYQSDPQADLQQALFFMSIIMGIIFVILIGMFFRGRWK